MTGNLIARMLGLAVQAGWLRGWLPRRPAGHFGPRDPVVHQRERGTESGGLFIGDGCGVEPGGGGGYRWRPTREGHRWQAGRWAPGRRRAVVTAVRVAGAGGLCR